MPGTTKRSASFMFYILDSSNQIIEQITSGVTIKPTIGSLVQASVSASNLKINNKNVQYKFTFIP
jgi:hypothetical protein